MVQEYMSEHRGNSDIGSSKRRLRRELRAAIAELSEKACRTAGEALVDRLKDRDLLTKGKALFAFASMAGEIDTEPLIQAAIDRGTRLHLPRVFPQRIAFFRVRDLSKLSRSSYGILEPPVDDSGVDAPGFRDSGVREGSEVTHPAPAANSTLPRPGDTVIVPGLGFTRDGDRLGRGGGYYDRFLSSIPDGVLTVGVCFSCQIRESLPADGHDVRVNEVMVLP